MEKGKRIEIINGENRFPETVIQRIQSFMTGKQAAQTTILSKSWYAAWLTRPNLDFHDFSGFLEIVSNTLQRYQSSNLPIESFSLRNVRSENPLTNELIVKALKMGASRLNLEFVYPTSEVILPKEVLESESLVGLSLNRCTIGGEGKLNWSRLESLSLSNVCVEGSVVQDIFSSCPLIHDLSFRDVRRRGDFDPIIVCPANQCPFYKLKGLLFYNVGVCSSFFQNFSSKFPCLRKLSVYSCSDLESVEITSASLEYVIFEQNLVSLELDLPNIRKFEYTSDTERATMDPVPCLSLETLSTEWESRVSIGLSKHPISSELLKRLNEFLFELSSSKIDLHLSGRWMCGRSMNIRSVSKVEVEELDLFVTPQVFLATVKGLFCICQPKLIRIISFPYECGEEKEPNCLIKFLLKEKESEKSELRDVHVKVSGGTKNSFELVPLNSFMMDVSRRVRYVKQISCFVLSWGEELPPAVL